MTRAEFEEVPLLDLSFLEEPSELNDAPVLPADEPVQAGDGPPPSAPPSSGSQGWIPPVGAPAPVLRPPVQPVGGR
jgi:hypothetical protein